MLTKNQLEIFEVFLANPFIEYSYKNLQKLSKEKSNNAFQLAVNRFRKEKLVRERKIGKSVLYNLDMTNGLNMAYLSLAANNRLNHLAADTVKDFIEELDKYTVFYSLVVFGSYSDNTYTKKSDLDIAILIPAKQKESDVKVAINTMTRRSVLELDCHAITHGDFLEMLKADYENLGKQIARKSLPVYNNAIFYKTVMEGMKNGFAH